MERTATESKVLKELRVHRVSRLVPDVLIRATLATLVVACVPQRPVTDAQTAPMPASDLAVSGRLQPHSHVDTDTNPSGTATGAKPEGPVLSRTALIRAVLLRNPEIDARRHALRAARARRAQVAALDDPELAYSFAPMTIGSGTFGQTVQVSQRFPWPGKRSNLGKSVQLESDAARHDVRATELDLAVEASLLFDDYYLVYRSLEVNEHHQHLLRELKGNAEAQFSVGRGSLQDPLQAEVELSRLVEESATLRSEREAIAASLNGLLHRSPSEPLPPPPRASVVSLDAPPTEAALIRVALAASPELHGLRARERAAESFVRYAEREYYPDFTLMASYNTMVEPDSRFMLGLSAPIPLQRGSRGGALDEAGARVSEVRAESTRFADRIRTQVSVARHRVVETIQVVKILEGRLLPVAKAQVAAALVDFAPGRTSFLAVVDGERNLRDAELSLHAATAELGRRRAQLDRALGRIPFAPTTRGTR